MTAADLTLNEAAELLGVHYMTAYRYVRLGFLQATKVGGCWRVAHSDLEVYRADVTPADRGVRRRAPCAVGLAAGVAIGGR